MSIVWHRWIGHKRGVSTVKDEGPSYTNTALVRTDDPDENLIDIRDAPGPKVGDEILEQETWVVCKSIQVRAADDSGLLWEVSFSYEPMRPDEGQQPGGGGGGGEGLPIPVWSASGSSSVVPVYQDTDGDVITNSAGDPLEGLQKEKSEFTLVLTMPYMSHDTWLDLARDYSDTVNMFLWNGGDPETWLCRFRSASLERKDGLVYWSVQWEFSYRAETWKLKPWDIGFHKLDPTGEGEYKKKAILGTDGKQVKQPVALAGGVPLPAGTPPQVIRDGLGAEVYKDKDFDVFGEVYTPTI